MTRILELTDPDGFVQVCDEACYDAPRETCHCICQGMHHGIGEQAARLNVVLFWSTLANKILPGQPKGTKLVINAMPLGTSLEINI